LPAKVRGIGTNPLPYLIAVVVIVLDQITKYLIVQNLGPGAPQDSVLILGGFVRLRYVTNSGAAFGWFPNGTMIFSIIAFIVAIVLIAYFQFHPTDKLLLKVSLGLQLGGALGNLIDRIHQGYVVDFVQWWVWGIFNVADAAITTGVVFLAIYLIFMSEVPPARSTTDVSQVEK
jgi:signal peptidase II